MLKGVQMWTFIGHLENTLGLIVCENYTSDHGTSVAALNMSIYFLRY